MRECARPFFPTSDSCYARGLGGRTIGPSRPSANPPAPASARVGHETYIQHQATTQVENKYARHQRRRLSPTDLLCDTRQDSSPFRVSHCGISSTRPCVPNRIRFRSPLSHLLPPSILRSSNAFWVTHGMRGGRTASESALRSMHAPKADCNDTGKEAGPPKRATPSSLRVLPLGKEEWGTFSIR